MSGRNFVLKIGGAVDSSLSKSFQTSSKEMKKLSDEMLKLKSTKRHISKLRASEQKLEQQFAKGREEYKRQQRELIETREKMNDLKKAMERTKRPSKSMINEFKRAQKIENKLRGTTEDQKKALADMMRQMKAAKEETKKYSQSQEELAKSMKKVEESQKRLKKYEDLKRSVSNNAGGTFARSAGQAAAIGAAVKMSIDEEEAFSNVRKYVDFEAAGMDAKTFKKNLDAATKSIPQFNAQIYEIAAAAGNAGVATKEVINFTKDTAKVSVAFDMDASTAGDTLATWRTAFKMTREEMMELADQTNQIGKENKVKAPQVAEVITAMGPLGEISGFTEAQVAALGGSLIAMGVKDAITASTGIRKLFTTLAAGDSATKDQAEGFKKIGIEVTQLAKDVQEGSSAAMISVFEGLKSLEKYEQLSVMKSLFGEEALAPMGLLVNNTEVLTKNLDIVNNKKRYAGSVDNEYAIKLDTTNTSLILVGKSLGRSAKIFGNVFLPVVNSTANTIGGFADKVSDFSERWPTLTKALAFGTAGLVGLKLGTSGAVMGLRMLGNTKKDIIFLKDTAMLVKGWKQWGPLLSGMKTGMMALGAAGKTMLFNPWVLGGAAILGIGYAIYKNWDFIKKGFKSTYEYISGKLSGLWKLWKKFKWPSGGSKKGSENDIPAYGRGGVVTSPHLAIVGDSNESIIPHDRSSRSKSLWYDAGRRMGMFAGEGVPKLAARVRDSIDKANIKNKVEINVSFNPVINGGAAKGVIEQMKAEFPQFTELIEDAVEKAMAKNQKMERRLSLG